MADDQASKSVKIRGPTPREQPSDEIIRLRKANLVNAYPIHREGSAMKSSLTQDERVRLFMWGLAEDSKMPSKRHERLPGGNPLVISDSARNYFQMGDTVQDAKNADEQARSMLSAKAEDNKPVPAIKTGALVRIGVLVVSGVAVVGVAYFFYKWWRKPGFPF